MPAFVICTCRISIMLLSPSTLQLCREIFMQGTEILGVHLHTSAYSFLYEKKCLWYLTRCFSSHSTTNLHLRKPQSTLQQSRLLGYP
uniref:Uncharacterized protein n=1 Tax=Rhipicephalus appendiculatus TaxID=34631 RepID=A0A131YHC1_RHIAP